MVARLLTAIWTHMKHEPVVTHSIFVLTSKL
jgi:hypothetical protein